MSPENGQTRAKALAHRIQAESLSKSLPSRADPRKRPNPPFKLLTPASSSTPWPHLVSDQFPHRSTETCVCIRSTRHIETPRNFGSKSLSEKSTSSYHHVAQ